eukprot:86631_1
MAWTIHIILSIAVRQPHSLEEDWPFVSLHHQSVVTLQDIEDRQQQFLIGLMESSLQNSKDQVESMQQQLAVMKQENDRHLKTISTLSDQLQTNDDWKAKYDAIMKEFETKTSRQLDHIMDQQINPALKDALQTSNIHKNTRHVIPSGSSYQTAVPVVSVLILLSLLGASMYRYAMYNTLKPEMVGNGAAQANVAVSEGSDPLSLSSVIVMDDTPTNSRPVTPRPTSVDSAPKFVIPNSSSIVESVSSKDIVFEEIKMSEIPDHIR